MQSNQQARMAEQKYLFKNPNHWDELNNARLSGKLCDITIKVNDKEFQAHKIILALNLKYFETMFLTSFQERNQDVITMQDVREKDMEALIMYAYTGQILITENNALYLFELANYLTEDSIKEACVDFLKTNLKKEYACLAYKLANSTECFVLKNVAKRVILSDFENCSLTAEYLSLDFESLKDILSYSPEFVQSQKIFFEGIVRWILHDKEARRLHVNQLLDQIDITKLRTDYLLLYFCKWIVDQNDIAKDIMSFYYQQIQHDQSLLIIGNIDEKVCVQFYNFMEKKWSPLRVVNGKNFDRATILNNMLYYTTCETFRKVNVFNPMTMECTMLISYSRLLRWSGVCVDNKNIYFCGGQTENGFASDQVLRYDPQTNSFELLPCMKIKRWSPAVIFYEDCLFILGGYDRSSLINSVERYDFDTKNWTVLASMSKSHYGSAAVNDGKVYAGTGFQTRGFQVYNFLKNSWKLMASMNRLRSSFFLVAYKSKLLAIGGDTETNNTVEVYDPMTDHWQIDVEMSSGLEINYPQGGLIPISFVSNNF